MSEITMKVESFDTPTMSSLEIAELCEKRHDHVMRDIRTMLIELHGEEGAPKFGDCYKNNDLGREYPCYNLPKRETLILVSGYNLQMRARIIDRWQELEKPPELTRLEILKQALLTEQENITLREKIEADAPHVAFSKQVELTPDELTLGQTAKAIGTGRTRLCKFMREIAWINRGNEPYQCKIEAGYLQARLSQWEHPKQGLQKRWVATVTGKGLVKLQRLWNERQEQINEAFALTKQKEPHDH